MATSARPFLMFEGQAEAAMQLYTSLFAGSEMTVMSRYPDTDKIMRGSFRVAGLEVEVTDSPIHHAFTFTPAASLFIECESEAELRRLADALGAQVLMPVDSYGFSRLFTWVADQFGVSWQLHLA
jgi:predicted 3-demethylubiquinone-9 3-methyltransferase (glyoxalase superfamily)